MEQKRAEPNVPLVGKQAVSSTSKVAERALADLQLADSCGEL